MSIKDRKAFILPAVMMASFVVTGCGGGGGGGGKSTPTEPEPTAPTVTETLSRAAGTCSLAQVVGTGADKGLAIDSIQLLQVVDQGADSADTILVENKDVLVKVNVTGPATTSPPAAKVIVKNSASSCTEITVTAPSSGIAAAANRRTAANSYTVKIPASLVQAGLRLQVVVDAGYAGPRASADRLYRDHTVTVKSVPAEDATIIPISFMGQVGAAPSRTVLEKLLQRTMPFSDVAVTTGEGITLDSLKASDATLSGGVYRFPASKLNDAHAEFETKCRELVGAGAAHETEKCIGLWPANVVFGTTSESVTGRAAVGGVSMLVFGFTSTEIDGVSTPYGSHWLSSGSLNLIHEYGHLMNLGHANCGVSGTTDADLYADGKLGAGGGYDSERELYFSATADSNFSDIMSYCGKGWMSDKGYRKVIDYKINGGAPVVDVI